MTRMYRQRIPVAPSPKATFDPAQWTARAACTGSDPDLFFPDRGESTREAKLICKGCPVREPCLEFALVHGEKFGVWGGMSEYERKRLRRRTSGAA